jgi:hypothetical protein
VRRYYVSFSYQAGSWDRNTPGIRVRPVRKRDLRDDWFVEQLQRGTPSIDASKLKPGDLVPWDGGELFVCKSGEGLLRIHADINAAQNLQRRFWTRHGDAFRMVAKGVLINGTQYWVPFRLGKRLHGALGGYGRLVPTGHDTGSCRWEGLKAAQWQKLSGEKGAGDEAGGDEADELQAGLEEETLEQLGQITTFFRDPSGNVLPADLWYPSKSFWSIVKATTSAAIRKGT